MVRDMATYMIALAAWMSPVNAVGNKDSLTLSLKNMFISQTTISPGFNFDGKPVNSYFHPGVEYFFQNRISARTDLFLFMASKDSGDFWNMNHQVLLGMFIHFPFSKFSGYFGWQPGVAIVQQTPFKYNEIPVEDPDIKAAPVISMTAGINYYFWTYLHFFANIQFLKGTHIPDAGNAQALDELRLSAGLAWQVRFKKKTNLNNEPG